MVDITELSAIVAAVARAKGDSHVRVVFSFYLGSARPLYCEVGFLFSFL